MNIEELSEQLFNNEPKPPKSIQIEFEGFDTEQLFKSLCMILTNGMKKFHGDGNGRVKISALGQDDLTRLNDYFKSMGLEFFINDREHRRSSELSEYELKLNSDGVKYKLFFDYLTS